MESLESFGKGGAVGMTWILATILETIDLGGIT